MSYTKGPWKCDAASFTDSDAVAYEVSADGMKISAANAWLISAAPDMAEALLLCVNAFGGTYEAETEAYEKAMAALAKAGL